MTKPLSLVLLLVLAGCAAVGPNYTPPKADAPSAFANVDAARVSVQPVERQFWKRFADPQLDTLIDRALKANHDVRIGMANLREARAARSEAGSLTLPSALATGGYRSSYDSAAQTRQPNPSKELRSQESYTAGFDASWEIDFFGSVRRSVEASEAQLGAAEASLEDLRVSVVAEVVRNYVELRGLQMQSQVAQKNLTNQQSTLDLVQARLDAGAGTELDTSRAKAQLESTRAIIPALEFSISRAIHRLGVLTGAQPTALTAELRPEKSIPAVPTLTAIETPDALLRRRADVRVAERNLAAATARIGVETANLFPKVTIGANIGLNAPTPRDLGTESSRFWGIGPSISWAIFDSGRIRSRITQREARAEAALAQYEQTVLRVLEETESALAAYSQSATREASLSAAASASENAARLARLRFEAGASDFLVVLDAERSVLQAQDQLAQSRTQTALALVALSKSLAGGL